MRRDETGLREADVNLRFLRGQQHPQAEGPASPFRPDASTYRFTLNVMNQLVKRKTALITDSRPQIDIMAFSKNRRGTAAVFKQTISALWDEANFDQSATRELVRAAVIGSTACVPMWNQSAKYGKGTIDFLMFDPRQVMVDPTITRAIDVQRSAQFAGVKEVLSLNAIRENWPSNGPRVKGSLKWSSYSSASTSRSRWQGIATAMQRPWRRAEELTQSASPRNEVLHTWFRDWPRDKRGQPIYTMPMFVRYVAQSDGVVLKDEPQVAHHGQIPVHLFDWDIELEHPWGISEVGGLRRIQYTLNRIMAQVVENILLTNRTKVVADTDAVDQATWASIASNPNGIFIRKRQGRTFVYETPINAVPNYIVQIIQLLLQGVDIVSGMTEVTRGVAPKGNTCADPETECLTRRGWMRYDALRQDDELYTVDPQTGRGVWSPILHLTVEPYQGPMVSMENARLSALVTPNHGWWVTSTNARPYGRPPYKRVETTELNSSHAMVNGALVDQLANRDSLAFVKLMGWIVTEGCYIRDKRKRLGYDRHIQITQSEKANLRKCQDIEEVLKVLDYPFSIYRGKDGCRVYAIRGATSRAIMERFPDGRLTSEWIASLSGEQAAVLYRTMMDGDGNVLANGHENYYCADAVLRDQFQMVATLAGYASATRVKRTGGRHRSARYGDMGVVSMRKERTTKFRYLVQSATTVLYDGLVWCPTTSTGTWFARRKGRVFFNGNSGIAIEGLQIAAQSIIRLEARAFENWLERIFQQVIALIWQYFSSDRLLYLVGPNKMYEEYLFDRAKLLVDDEHGKLPDDGWKDFTFKVLPGSSLAMTRVQKGVLASNLYQLGLIPGIEVLRAAEYPNPEEMVKQAREESAMGMGPSGGGGGKRRGGMQSFPNTSRRSVKM